MSGRRIFGRPWLGPWQLSLLNGLWYERKLKDLESLISTYFNKIQQKCLKEQGQDWRRLCLPCRRLISLTHVASSYFIVIAVVKSCTTHSSMETGERWNSSWCMWLSDLANCKPFCQRSLHHQHWWRETRPAMLLVQMYFIFASIHFT